MKKDYRIVRLVISLLVTISIFIFLFSKIPFSDVLSSIRGADFGIIFLALVVASLNNFLTAAYRWKLILKEIGCPISFREALVIKMGSDPVISFLPFRSGEFFKPLYLKKIKQFPYSKTIISIISEYLLNILALLALILAGLVIQFLTGNNCIFSMNLSAFCFCLAFYSSQKNFRQGRRKLYFEEFKKLLRKKNIFLYTLLYMLIELIVVYFLSIALSNPIPFGRILVFMPIIILVSNIPITILGLGIREAGILFFFAGSGSSGILLSLGVLYSFTEHIFPTILSTSLTGHLLTKVFWKKK